MVKEVELTVRVEGCTAQAFFDIIYKDATAARSFHKEIHHDDNITVTPWVDGRRTVEATMPVNLPATVKNMLGTDKIPVVDTQELKLNGGKSFEVTSTPVLQIPGGGRFTTGARITVSNGQADDCEIIAVVTCTAAIWGMQAFVEGIMAEQAKTGVQEFLDFCKAFVSKQLSLNPVLEGIDTAASDVSDEFFDIQQESEVDLDWYLWNSGQSQGTDRSIAVAPNNERRAQQLEVRLEEVLRNVDSMSSKLDEVQKSLRKLEASRINGGSSWGLYFFASLSIALALVLVYLGRQKQ